MWEKLFLAATVTFSLYLFLSIGEHATSSTLMAGNLLETFSATFSSLTLQK